MNKIIQKILTLLPNSTRDPFFILKGSGEILHTNMQGSELLNISESPGNITDYFQVDTKKRFNELLDQAVETNNLITIDHLELELITGSRIKTQLILNIFEDKNDLIVFCTIIPKQYSVELKKNSRIKIQEADIQKIIKSESTLELLNKVESLFPFTFIGKEIMHKIIDTIDEVFWITDNEGRFILVNDYFAEAMGLKPFQMEGKLADDFIPGYLKELDSLIEKFIKETISSVVLEGIKFREIENLKNREIIQVPLFDEEKNIEAIIGISQQKELDDKAGQKEELFDVLYKIIDYFPKPVAFITSDGIIKHASEEFCKLFERKSHEFDGVNFVDILPGSLAESLQRFINSSDNQRNLPLNRHFEIENRDEPEFTVHLTKFFGSENQAEGFSILVEKIEYIDNLQQLIKSNGKMFEFLIQNNPEPIYIYYKEDLKFVEVNQAALDLYEYTKDEFLQLDLTDLYNPEDIQSLLGSSAGQENETKFSKPLRQKRKDGSSVFVEISKIKFKFNDKDAHFNIIKDVTEKLELDKKNQLFKAAFDNTVDLIITTDADGIISFVNNVTINILGSSKDELENSSLISLAVDEDRSTINTSIFKSKTKEPVSLKVGLKSSGGDKIDTEISATPIIDFEGNIDSFVIIGKVIRDPSVDRETKEIIKEVIVEKPVQSDIDDSLQLESVFLSGVFHEILTPMNVILGFAQELAEGKENLNQNQKEAVEIINQNRGKLLSTMNAIIEFSEIQKKRDEWNISEITITELVDGLDKDIYEITGSRDVEFAYGKISSSLKFKTDKLKFDCLVNNLIRLICRIGKEKKIYFSAYPIDNDYFIIIITDNYASSSDHLADTLKKIFVYNNDPKEIGVSKLGTQITKSLLELLQGKFVSTIDSMGKNECGFKFPINFELPSAEAIEKPTDEVIDKTEKPKSTPSFEKVTSITSSAPIDHGIEIEEEIEVPEPIATNIQNEIKESLKDMTPPEESDITETPPADYKKPQEEITIDDEEEIKIEETEPKQIQSSEDKLVLSNLTCLYVEDQIDSQILFKVQMKGLKDVKYAISLEESFPLLESEHFDFIVMDINLQGEYNGIDALKIIHNMQNHKDIPIIAVTAYVLPGDKEKFIATGFSDFISKPIFREKMIETLENIFLQKI